MKKMLLIVIIMLVSVINFIDLHGSDNQCHGKNEGCTKNRPQNWYCCSGYTCHFENPNDHLGKCQCSDAKGCGSCQTMGQTCNPSKYNAPCCSDNGASCTYVPAAGDYICIACKTVDEVCSESSPCCGTLECPFNQDPKLRFCSKSTSNSEANGPKSSVTSKTSVTSKNSSTLKTNLPKTNLSPEASGPKSSVTPKNNVMLKTNSPIRPIHRN